MLLTAVSFAAGLDLLPAEIQKDYEFVDPKMPVGPSVYKDWKPKHGPPWKLGYASNYSGNTWRAGAMDRLEKLIPEYKKYGLVKDVVVMQSDLKDAVQIQQMRQMVDEGVDALWVCCSNITAMNDTIKYAYDKGVAVFSYSGYVTSPYAISATTNYAQGGYVTTKSLLKQLGGKGNVLLVSGIPGQASCVTWDYGAHKALEEYPNVKLVGTIQGMWTDQVAQVEVQKWLATHPQKLDGIIIQSAQETGVLKALLQSGRPMIPISLGGEKGAACYWRKHPGWVTEGFHVWPPGDEMELVWDIMIRTLEGQGPKIESIMRKAVPFTYEDVVKELPEDCSIDDTS